MEHRLENPLPDPKQVLKEKLMRQKAKNKAEFEERMQKIRQERANTMAAEAAKAEEEHFPTEDGAEVKEIPIEESQTPEEQLQNRRTTEVKEVPIEQKHPEGAQLHNGESAKVEEAEEVPTEDSGKVDELANEDSPSAPRVTGSAEITAVSQNAALETEEESYVATSEMECKDGEYRSFSVEHDLITCDGSIDEAKEDACSADRSVQTAADFCWNSWSWRGCCNCYSGFSERCPNFIETGCGGGCCCTEEKQAVRPDASDPLPTSEGRICDYEALSSLSTYSGSTSGRIREKPLCEGKKFRQGPKRACGEFGSLPRRDLKEHRRPRRRRRRRLRCALSGQRAWAEEARGSSLQSSLAARPRGTLTERLLRARSCVERANNETECVPSSSPLLPPTRDPPPPSTTKHARQNQALASFGSRDATWATSAFAGVAPRNRSSESRRELGHRRPAPLQRQRRRPRSSLRRAHRSAILLRELGPRQGRDLGAYWLRSSLAPGRERRADHYLKSDAERRDRECLSKLEVLATPKRCSFRPDDVRTTTPAAEGDGNEVQDRGQDAKGSAARAGGQDVFGRDVQRLRGGGSDVDEFSDTKQRTDARRAGAVNDSQPDPRSSPSGSRWEGFGETVEPETEAYDLSDEEYPEPRSRTLRFRDEKEEESTERQEDSGRVRGGCGRSSKYATDSRYGLQTKHSRRQLHYQSCSHSPPRCSPVSYPPAYSSRGGCRPPPCLPPCPPQPCCHTPPCPPPSCHPPPCPPPLCRPPPCPPPPCPPPPCPPPPCPPPPCLQPSCVQCQRLASSRQRDCTKGCCYCGGCGRSSHFETSNCNQVATCRSAPRREQYCSRPMCPSCKDFQSCGVCGGQSCGRIYSYPGSAGGTCCFPRNTRKRSGSECCGGGGNPGCGGCC